MCLISASLSLRTSSPSNSTSPPTILPGGFATTSNAYRDFLNINSLDKKINNILKTLDVNDIPALSNAGKNIRKWILETKLPEKLTKQIEFAWKEMSKGNDISVAVRSSATAEDLPEASFAGQQETFLNIRGCTQKCEACVRCLDTTFIGNPLFVKTLK